MKHSEEFHKAFAYVVVLLACLIVIAGIFVPMMVEIGGDMAAFGIPLLGACFAYLLGAGINRAQRAYYKRLERK